MGELGALGDVIFIQARKIRDLMVGNFDSHLSYGT